MKKIGLLLLVIGMIGASGCGLRNVKENRELELPAGSIETLDIRAVSGNIVVKGDDNADKIHAEAVIETSTNVKKEDIIFTLKQDGNSATLVSDFKPAFGFQDRSMDITVTVPSGMNIDLKDDSGDIEMKDIKGKVEINDDSGDIDLVNVKALTSIDDDSGDIIMDNTGGNVTVRDESGELRVKNHTGDLDITDDSGDIIVTNLNGSVVVDDESGDIKINGVERDVTIQSDGSGEITVDQVKGKYTKK